MKKRIILPLLLAAMTMCMPLQAAAAHYGTTGICPLNDPYHILVTPTRGLSSTYIPSNLVMPNVTFASPGNIQKNYMEATAAKALETMFADAKSQGIKLVAVSGYRSYSRQQSLYRNAVAASGPSQNGTAKPGHSEHQTGLAMDLNSISQSFEYTKEGKWVAQNAHLYGYIIRYPKGKTSITGFIYEPWHIRYVGKELASYCYTNNLTLEEIINCHAYYEEIEQPIQTWTMTESSSYSLLRIQGVTYIKARDLMTLLSGQLTPSGTRLTLSSNNHDLIINANNRHGALDHSSILLTNAPLLIEGSYYVPMRNVLNLLGYSLDSLNPETFYIDLNTVS